MSSIHSSLNLILKLIPVIAIILFEQNPEYYGERFGRIAVAYDSIWAEYMVDCDCTEEYMEP